MMRKRIVSFAFLLGFFALNSTSFAAFHRPKLIVLVVIDQFRADYLTRFESQFLPPIQKDGKLGGFRYLMTHGAYFPQAKYDVMNSVTAVGHMTISTGSYPYQSGIVANEWLNQDTQKEIYCTEDPQFPLLGGNVEALSDGRSPRNLIGSTIGDQLKLSYPHSKVLSLSIKDRAAILLGGHTADLALWLNRKAGVWTSSEYYLPTKKLPSWVERLNEKTRASGKLVEKLGEKSNYKDSIASPIGNEMTAEAVEAALSAFQLGGGNDPDLFAVSLSSHDAAGHKYGPNSPEMEEMTISDDRTLSRILNAVQATTPDGLKNTLIVLTGDHGAAPNEEWSKLIRLPYEKIDTRQAQDQLNKLLETQFGKPSTGSWVVAEMGFHFYLNQPEIRSKGLDLGKMEAVGKSFLKTIPGVAHVFTSSEVISGRLPPGKFERQILHSYFPGRSGDLVVIPRPFVTPRLGNPKATTHVTGYSYDQTVPILIAGSQVHSGTYASQAEVIDIAPTVTFLAGVIAPSSSEGRVLSEVINIK